MAGPTLAELAETLASVRLSGWQGLPARLDPGPLDDEPALVSLGSDYVPADLVHLDDPAQGTSARAWLRDGFVALLDVAWLRPVNVAALSALEVLGEPAERNDVVDGLARLPDGEWLYPGHGLAAVVDTSSHRLRRLLGFVPTTAEAYRRELQPDFASQRRPIEHPVDHGGTT